MKFFNSWDFSLGKSGSMDLNKDQRGYSVEVDKRDKLIRPINDEFRTNVKTSKPPNHYYESFDSDPSKNVKADLGNEISPLTKKVPGHDSATPAKRQSARTDKREPSWLAPQTPRHARGNHAIRTLRRASQTAKSHFCSLKRILRPVFGISLALLQCLSMAFVFLLISNVKGVSPLAIGNMRMIFQLLVSLPLTLFNSDPVLPPKRYALPVLIRCVSGTLGVVSLMFAMSYAPISDASSIVYTSPIFVAILARIFLAERISLIDACLLVVTVSGVLFITRPAIIFDAILPPTEPAALEVEQHYPKHYLGLAFAATSAFTSSVAIVAIRKVRSLPLSLILVDFSVVGIIVTTILCFSLKVYSLPSCTTNDRILLVASSFLGSFGQFFLYGALRFENAGIISATASMGIVFTFILQVVYKGETPPWTSWLGAALVTTSIMALGFHKWLVGRKALACSSLHASRDNVLSGSQIVTAAHPLPALTLGPTRQPRVVEGVIDVPSRSGSASGPKHSTEAAVGTARKRPSVTHVSRTPSVIVTPVRVQRTDSKDDEEDVVSDTQSMYEGDDNGEEEILYGAVSPAVD